MLLVVLLFYFFFFKQKTAYEMRISDWSSDVCASELDIARLPETLLRAGKALGRTDFIECGLVTLEWIVAQQTAPEGHFRAVGTDSFGREYQPPLPFDQQPLEAHATVDACTAAYEVTGNVRWRQEARSEEHTSELQSLM